MVEEVDLSQAILLLRQADVRISGGNLEALSLTLPDASNREVAVHIAESPPTPSKIDLLLARPQRVLVVTSRPGRAVTEAARTDRLDLITISPASVVIGGVELLGAPAPEPVAAHHGRAAWGRWAIMRTLALATEPLTQKELADAAGISQPAVNKNLKNLLAYVHRGPHGWSAPDRNALLSWWLVSYPGPRGASTYWYSLKSAVQQAEDAAKFAEQMGAKPLISGDAAADLYAPWRLPDTVRLYLREVVDFTDAGFTPASPDEATLIVTIPEDPTLWPTAHLSHREGLALADPLVTLRDVAAGGAADSQDAAEHLREAILDGAAR